MASDEIMSAESNDRGFAGPGYLCAISAINYIWRPWIKARKHRKAEEEYDRQASKIKK